MRTERNRIIILLIISKHQIFRFFIFRHIRNPPAARVKTVIDIVIVGGGYFKQNHIAGSRNALPLMVLSGLDSYGLSGL